MAVELVTGATGSDHVSSDDAAHLHAGIVGRGSYALGGAPEVSMTDANTLSIPACDLVLEGRHVRLTGITEAKVASGGQSAHRRDLVCVRYALDQSRQVESASVVVVQGQVAYSAAAAKDPELPSKGSILALDPTVDVPIARVTLAGLSPAAEWLLPVVPPLAEVGRVERGKVNGNLSYERFGSLVIAHVFNVHNGKDAGYMPVGMRPSQTVYGGVSYSRYGGFARVEPSGRVLVWSEADGEFTGQCVYLAV